MKILIILFIAINYAVAQEYTEGVTIQSSRDFFETPADTSICATAVNNFAFCSSTPGCDMPASFFKCYNGFALGPKSCAEPTPYCSGGMCVPDPPSECTIPSTITCPGEGYFPVPDSCYEYIYCYFDPSLADFVGIARVCNIGYPFTPAGPDTLKCKENDSCVSPTCTVGLASEWRGYVYTGLPRNQIALYCVNGKPIRIDSCSGNLSIDLKATNTKKCILRCTKKYQIAAYEFDKTKYYKCYNGTAYLEQCEFGEIFDDKSLTCFDPLQSTTESQTTTLAPTTRSIETPKTASSFCTANIAADTYFCNYGCTKGAQAYKCTSAGISTADAAVACLAASATPYCAVSYDGTSATCTSLPNVNCLKCPRAGIFPDYQNCSRFFYCVQDSTTGTITATSYSCPDGEYFTPSSQSLCSQDSCVQPRCTRKAAEWRPYNYAGYTYNHYGLYCVGGTALFIDSCPAGLSLEYTQTATKNCYLRCEYYNSGNRAADIDDNTKYLECTNGIVVTQSCPSGQIFNPDTLSCNF